MGIVVRPRRGRSVSLKGGQNVPTGITRLPVSASARLFNSKSRDKIMSTSAAATKSPSLLKLVKEAIATLGGKGGASSQAIKKYLQENCGVDVEKKAKSIRNALNSGVEKGELIRTKGKGAAGTFKIDSTKEKAAAKAKAAKEKERVKAKKEREMKAEKAKKAKIAEKAKKAKMVKKAKKPAAKKSPKKAAKKTPSKSTKSSAKKSSTKPAKPTKPAKKPASKTTSSKQKKVSAKPSKK